MTAAALWYPPLSPSPPLLRLEASVRITQREYDVAFVAKPGRPVKQMAGLLDISPSTVEKHLRNLAAKFGDGTSPLQTVLYYRAQILACWVPVVTPDDA